jgi:chemotaxis protein methyltransferase CheR
MEDDQFRQLLQFFNRSWKGYRKVRKGVKKRVARHMQTLGCRRIETYLKLLASDDAVLDACNQLMAVSISRFFRDRRVWEILKNEILPELAEGREERVCLWSAGCARGEEAYSLRIAWEEIGPKRPDRSRLEILATDIRADYLEQAREGVYNRGSVRELSAEQLSRYFIIKKGGRRLHIQPELKTGIQWKRLDLTTAQTPDHGFDLICLRNNLLTYFQDPEKSTAFKHVTSALKAKGYLIIGAHEQLPAGTDLFTPISGSKLIYRYTP